MGNCDCNKNKGYYDKDSWIVVEQNLNKQVLLSLIDDKTKIQKWWNYTPPTTSDMIWRKNNSFRFLPSIIENGDQINQKTGRQTFYVITKPLTPIKKINYFGVEAVFIARQVLLAMQVLTKKFGWFGLNSDMVFVDEMGRPSAWINSNIASNQPQFPIKNSQIKEEDIVELTLKVVGKHLNPYEASYLNFKKTFKNAEIELNNYLNKFQSIKEISLQRNDYEKKKCKGSSLYVSETLSVKNSQRERDSNIYFARNSGKLQENRVNNEMSQNNNLRKIKSYQQLRSLDPDMMLQELIKESKISFI